MDTNKLVGKILVRARHMALNEIVETIIAFEDRGETIYYCWTFKNLSGVTLATKCLSVSKKVIDTNNFDLVISHAKSGIDNYKIDRQKVFEVLEVKNV